MESEDFLALIIVSYFLIAPNYLIYVSLTSIYWLVTKTFFHLTTHLELLL